jgi:hypothetical protein
MANASLIKKLGIKPKQRFIILNAIGMVKPGGRLWLSYPKQSSKVPIYRDFYSTSTLPCLHLTQKPFS